MKPVFKNPQFIKTAVKATQYPVLKDDGGRLLPEIAVAGRSNVGKSTLLNHLFHVKGLVKTSATPGKTQALNFFTLNDQLAFVDLPGYGYAKVPQSVRQEWGNMIGTYFQRRETLKLVLLLIDIRRVPNEEDRQLIDWVAYHQKALLVVLTKVDKVSLNEKNKNTRTIIEALGTGNIHYIHYSATKNIGRQQLCAMIADAIADETA